MILSKFVGNIKLKVYQKHSTTAITAVRFLLTIIIFTSRKFLRETLKYPKFTSPYIIEKKRTLFGIPIFLYPRSFFFSCIQWQTIKWFVGFDFDAG